MPSAAPSRPTPPRPGELPVRTHRRAAVAATAPRRDAETPGAPARSSSSVPVGAGSIQRLAAAVPALTAASTGSSGSAESSDDIPAPQPVTVPVRRGVQRAPESVPPAVRNELEPQFGESLAAVRVHRGPEVGEAAKSISAKAFATGGEVFLPDEHGPATSGEGRKILSHELTHVVQQRRLGADLPDEGSAAGAALEREAREVGGQSTPVPARPLSAAGSGGARSAQRLASPSLPPRPSRPVPAAATDLDPAAQAAVVARIQAAASGAGIPANLSSNGGSAGPAPQRLADSGPQAPTPTAPTTSSTSSISSTTSASAARTSSVSANAPSAPAERSADDLDALAGQLYPRMRTRLRSELLSDRERSGRLFDR